MLGITNTRLKKMPDTTNTRHARYKTLQTLDMVISSRDNDI